MKLARSSECANLSYAWQYLETLEYAAACAEQGAHIRTICILTGFPLYKLRTLFRYPLKRQRGRHPNTREWYYTTNLLNKVEASLIVSLFKQFIAYGIEPPCALLEAYRYYCACYTEPPRISFDRAFDLISHATQRWVASTAGFSMQVCPNCRCEFLSAVKAVVSCDGKGCPYCKLRRRYDKDARIKSAYPSRPLPAISRLLVHSLSLSSWGE
jgi:hypothetical protein